GAVGVGVGDGGVKEKGVGIAEIMVLEKKAAVGFFFFGEGLLGVIAGELVEQAELLVLVEVDAGQRPGLLWHGKNLGFPPAHFAEGRDGSVVAAGWVPEGADEAAENTGALVASAFDQSVGQTH